MSAELTPREILERWREGLGIAADRARQIAAASKDSMWTKIAFQLDGLKKRGEQLYAQKALTRQEVLTMLDDRVTKAKQDEEKKGLIH